MSGAIRIGVGGWSFEPWRGVFYPAGLPQRRELEFASRALTSIEINGTYYSTFKPDSWRKWREETPDGFVFAVKASRFCTTRRVLAGAAESIERFIGQGLTELGDRLGPINWQFGGTKKFDPEDFGAFLALLPKEKDGIALRHAIEVRSPSFATASATRAGSSASSGPGMPVATLQNEQARVQVSPMIIMVAWRCDQHSPILGQAASSQTVTRPLARIRARVSW